ncbi:pentatricopeptide repeat-containing protein at4g17616 [Phtheirospermum japonicum]|uniref:Pentatricopeptide repeat-containing protein at4g17616 n=1 Tax=Phtheirospermum japonicum TaxID=374723 RepID=A0A830CFM0_9LAMI|nr:pentatricopeptide repeat-containing protein at4g17616 [Phtheirospermum japonicum]
MFPSLIRANQRGFLRLLLSERFAFISHNVSYHQHLNRYDNPFRNPSSKNFSTIGTQLEKLYSKGPSRWFLQEKLEKALKEHQVDDALEIYYDFKRLYGYPDQFLVANLISELSYKSDSRKCLQKACDLVTSISKEKPVLLKPDLMTKVTLALGRAQIPVLASNVLRLMLEKKILPSSDILQIIFLHLIRTEIGTYLSSNILDEIFQKLNAEKSSNTELTKPDSTIFNLVLDACVRFKAPLKGHLIIELMAFNGVIGDAHTAVIIARLHEMNGNRDELNKYKECIDMVPKPLIHHYRQFYDCLLSSHFKFNDIDSASAVLYGELVSSRKFLLASTKHWVCRKIAISACVQMLSTHVFIWGGLRLLTIF